MTQHDVVEHIADGLAGHVRQPIVGRRLCLVPTGLREWRRVRHKNHVLVRGEGLRKHATEVVGRFVAQPVQQAKPVCLADGRQFADQEIVIERYGRSRVIAVSSIGPALVTDQPCLRRERYDARLPQPAEPGAC